MGFIRGFFFVIVAILLFLSFLTFNLFWILSSSLDYDNVQNGLTTASREILKNSSMENYVQNILPVIQSYCQNNSNYVFSYEGSTVDIPCEIALQGKDAIIEESIKDIVNEIYYDDYECEFIECFDQGQTPLFLVSEKSYNYCADKFRISLIVSLVLLVLMFLLIEKKTNMPILAGILLIVSSLPFIKVNSILSLFSDKVFVRLLGIFLSQAYSVSLKILIAGIVLVIIGIILKIFKIGFFISGLISRIRKKPTVAEKPQKMQQPKKNVKKRKKK